MGTKDTILALLEKNKGFFLSGEKIANELNISRTAVWKAVKKLQQAGYEIEAITNRGYCLSKDSDVLSAKGIRHFLTDECSDIRPDIYITVDSTNAVCLNKAIVGESEGYLAVAGSQTLGRGRRGRHFFSPAGTGIYMSLLLKPDSYQPSELPKLTGIAAVAVCEAIEALTDHRTQIKWVNDILIDGKKVCGILCEASFLDDSSYAVIGIGINAYCPKEGFPEDIADTAGYVFEQFEPGQRNHLAAEVINRFMSYYKKNETEKCFDEYEKRSLVLDKDVKVLKRGSSETAHVLGLEKDFGLRVRFEDGSEEVLRSGEISILPADKE